VTIAVCLKCGATKVGALTACPTCGFEPTTPDEGARSIFLSDQAHHPNVLPQLAALIAAGKPIPWDEAAVAGWREQLEQHGPDMPLGCHVVVWLPIIVMFVLLALVLYLWWAGS
jgi:hypothetical protein